MSILQVVVGAVVVVEKRLNEDAADVAVVGANENVLAVAGFETAKPNDEPVDAVLAAGNNEVLPPPEKKINQFENYKSCFVFRVGIYQN